MRKSLKKLMESLEEIKQDTRTSLNTHQNKNQNLYQFLKNLLKENLIEFHDVDEFQELMQFTLESMMKLKNNFKHQRNNIQENEEIDLSSFIETTHTQHDNTYLQDTLTSKNDNQQFQNSIKSMDKCKNDQQIIIMQKPNKDNQVKKTMAYTYQYDDGQKQLYKPKKEEQRLDKSSRSSLGSKSSYTALSEKQNQPVLSKGKGVFLKQNSINKMNRQKIQDLKISDNMNHNVKNIIREDRIKKHKNKLDTNNNLNMNSNNTINSRNQNTIYSRNAKSSFNLEKKIPATKMKSNNCIEKNMELSGSNRKRSVIVNTQTKKQKKIKKSRSKKKIIFKEVIQNGMDELNEKEEKNNTSISFYSNDSELSNYHENIDPEKIVQKNINEKNKLQRKHKLSYDLDEQIEDKKLLDDKKHSLQNKPNKMMSMKGEFFGMDQYYRSGEIARKRSQMCGMFSQKSGKMSSKNENIDLYSNLSDLNENDLDNSQFTIKLYQMIITNSEQIDQSQKRSMSGNSKLSLNQSQHNSYNMFDKNHMY